MKAITVASIVDLRALRRRFETESGERSNAGVAQPEAEQRRRPPTSSIVSVRSWPAMRASPAPSAWRVASSFIRALDRTSIRLVTFTAPTSSTNTTPPQSRYRVPRRSWTRKSWSGTTTVWKPALIRICFNCGKRSRLRAFSASICWRACSTVAPSFSRATYRPVVAVPLLVGFLLGRERDRQPDLHLGIEEPELPRQHADDGERLAVDADVAADGAVLPAEPLLPRRVGQDRLAGLAWFRFFLGEEAPADRLRPQEPQQRRRAHHRDDPLGLGVAAERHAARVVERLLLEYGRVAQPIVVVRHARRAADHPGAGVGVVHMDELPGLRHRQRLQQHGIDDREDRGVGADAEGERQDRRGREAAVLPQQPEPEPYVLQHSVLYGRPSAEFQRSTPTFPLLLTSNMNEAMLLLVINREGNRGTNKTDVLQGTLDLMVMKTLESMGSQHGYGIAQRLQQVSEDLLRLNQGTLYPALLRLEQRGWISSKWGTSENNRRARFYTLTRAGRKQLQREADDWHRMAGIMTRLLGGAPPAEELP